MLGQFLLAERKLEADETWTREVMVASQEDRLPNGVRLVQTSIRRIWDGGGQRSEGGNGNRHENADQDGGEFLQLLLSGNESAQDAAEARPAEELLEEGKESRRGARPSAFKALKGGKEAP